MSEWMTDEERCPLECPHGDRCALRADSVGPDGKHFCSHRVCFCNEPNAPRAVLRVDENTRQLTQDVIANIQILVGAIERQRITMDDLVAELASARRRR